MKHKKRNLLLVSSLAVVVPFIFPVTPINSILTSNALLERTTVDLSAVITSDYQNLGIFINQPTALTIISRLDENSVSWTTKANWYINEIEINSITSTSAVVSPKSISYHYTPGVNVTINFSIQDKDDLANVITNTVLFDDPDDSGWTEVPTQSQLFQRILVKNPGMSLNQITCNMDNVVLTPPSDITMDPRGTYSIAISAKSDSNSYTGIQTVTFKLNQRWVSLLGLILLFNGNQSVETDPSINPSNSKLINLNRGGEYDIFDDGTGVTTRGINILSGTDTAPINTTLNFDTGNVSLVKPTSAAAITLGEYNNVQLNINATSTNFTGYDPGSTQKDSWPGIRVPYSATLTIAGSSTLTCTGGSSHLSSAIGGRGYNGSGSKTSGDCACGLISFQGDVSANLTSGRNYGDGSINGSAVIGGGGANTGSAGSCRGVIVNTSGKITCTQPAGSSWQYGKSAVIGGGGIGSTMNVQGAAGDLEKFEMHQGTLTLNCVSNSNVIPNATKLGGGTVTSDGGNPTQSTSGDLYDFTMTGGTLAINCPSEIGSYASQTNTQRAQFETTIGGGGILTARRNNSGTFTANLGSLKSFNMSGGNIINYGAFCNRVNGSMIGAGSLLDGTPTATAHTVITNYGTIGTFNITGGSMLMTRDNTTTYNFKSSEGNERIQKNPTDALGRILYPVYVPTVINGFNTIGKTVNIASLAYSAALQDYSAYDSFNTYTGVLWLPAGICNDIQIESNVYTCTVVASNTPFANIIQ